METMVVPFAFLYKVRVQSDGGVVAGEGRVSCVQAMGVACAMMGTGRIGHVGGGESLSCIHCGIDLPQQCTVQGKLKKNLLNSSCSKKIEIIPIWFRMAPHP